MHTMTNYFKKTKQKKKPQISQSLVHLFCQIVDLERGGALAEVSQQQLVILRLRRR